MRGAVQASETATEAPAQDENDEGSWVPVCKPEEVPKGELVPENVHFVTRAVQQILQVPFNT